MAPRAYWKGHVRLSLVSFPVQLIPAIETKERVSFHRVHRPTGQRVRYQPVVPDRGPVDSEEIGKGYEYEKGRFVMMDDEEVDKLKLESTHTLDIVQFVDDHEIDPLYYEKPYFVLPDGAFAEDAFRVVRDAMRETKKVAIGQIVLSTRERVAAVRPCDRGLLLETLRYADEVRPASRYFAEIGERAVGWRAVGAGEAAHQDEVGAVRSGKVQGSLPGGAARTGRGQAAGPRAERPEQGSGRSQGDQPHGSAEAQPQNRRARRGDSGTGHQAAGDHEEDARHGEEGGRQ